MLVGGPPSGPSPPVTFSPKSRSNVFFPLNFSIDFIPNLKLFFSAIILVTT
jgi:hypothetical protein